MNKQDKLRQALLGDELYLKCNNKYGASTDDVKQRIKKIQQDPLLQARLQELIGKYSDFSDCSVDEFVQMCGFNYVYEQGKKGLQCLQAATTNQIYYNKHRENYYYDIVELVCADENDVKMLSYYQQLEAEQQNEFTEYLSLQRMGCNEEGYHYYIAFNRDTQTIGGVAITVINNGILQIKFLTTRAGKTRSPVNQGVGTTILNYIVNKVNKQNASCIDDCVLLIQLYPDDKAIPFYLKYGFEFLNPYNANDKTMIYNLEILKHLDPSSKLASQYLQLFIEFENEDVVRELKAKNYHLDRSRKQDNLRSLLAIRYFFDELKFNPTIITDLIESGSIGALAEYIRLKKINFTNRHLRAVIDTFQEGSRWFGKQMLVLLQALKSVDFEIEDRNKRRLYSLAANKFFNAQAVDMLIKDFNYEIDEYLYEDALNNKTDAEKVFDVVKLHYKPLVNIPF